MPLFIFPISANSEIFNFTHYIIAGCMIYPTNSKLHSRAGNKATALLPGEAGDKAVALLPGQCI